MCSALKRVIWVTRLLSHHSMRSSWRLLLMLWRNLILIGQPREGKCKEVINSMSASSSQLNNLHVGVCLTLRCRDPGKKPYSSRLSSFSRPSVHQYSSIVGLKEKGYGMMARVEETLASYLSPDAASSLKPRYCPPSRAMFYHRWWARHIWQQVRLVLVYTQWPSFKCIKPTC